MSIEDKIGKTRARAGAATASGNPDAASIIQADFSNATIGAYAGKYDPVVVQDKDDFNKSKKDQNVNQSAGGYKQPIADLAKDEWEKSKKPLRWDQDPKKRIAIRAFSRGLMGAAFFTGGNLLTKKWIRNAQYDPKAAWAEQNNPLKVIAKAIDEGVGKPITFAVNAMGGDGIKAVHFRPTAPYHMEYSNPVARGRSLGDEAVSITFDFFCASVGDAFGRDIVGWFDPSVKKAWKDDKGNINLPEGVKAAAKSVARYITYNGGEDWAVAIPYAYFMKAQRALIDRHRPGFKFDFDVNANGSAHKLDANYNVAGSFAMEGALDLQSRFTVYNIGTLMYREAYNHVANLIAGKPTSLYGAPDVEQTEKDKKKGLLTRAGDAMKWAARSTIKGVIYMTPSVPFFWITRTSQNKHIGSFISPEGGALAMMFEDGERKLVLPSHLRRLPPEHELYFARYTPDRSKSINGQFDRSHTVTASQLNDLKGNPYHMGHGAVEGSFNWIGRKQRDAREWVDARTNTWDDRLNNRYGSRPFKNAFGIRRLADFSSPMFNASASYFPYMAAKAEFANLWDTGKMDKAAEDFIDGLASLNLGKIKAGSSEIYRAFMHQPFDDVKSEAEAQRRNRIDQSPSADKLVDENWSGDEQAASNWQERIFSGKPLEKKSELREIKPKLAVTKRADKYVDNELLAKLIPPTNAIN